MATSYRVGSASLRVFPDMTGFHSQLARETRGIEVRVGVNADQAGLRTFANSLSAVGRSVTIQINVDATRARVEINGLESQARRLSGQRFTINWAADIGAAMGAVLRLRAAVLELNGRRFSFTVDADTTGAVASIARLVAMTAGLGGAIGIAGGLAGALGGIAPAAGGALLGVIPLVGAFNGVGAASKALNDQQVAAGTTALDTARKQVQAANQITSAQLQLQRATRSVNEARADGAREVAQAEQQAATAVQAARDQATAAARDVSQAIRSQQTAQRELASATGDLRFAQSQLNQAWIDGRRALQDLQDQADGVALDQRQATLDLADARERLATAQGSGDTREIARAQLAVDRLIEQQDVLAKRAERTNEANVKGQAAGVAGTQQVIDANARILQAQEAVDAAKLRAGDADVALGEARARQGQADAAVDAARVKGAQDVALAKEMAGRRIVSAEESAADAARALAMAQMQAADSATAATDKVAKAFADLTPSQAEFAKFWFGLSPLFDRLNESFASKFFPGLTAGLKLFAAQEPAVARIASTLGGAFGAAALQVLTILTNPTWMAFFQFLADQAAQHLPALIQTFFMFADVVRILITAFAPFTPMAIQLFQLFAQLLTVLAPVVAVFLGGLIPVAALFIQALMPLAPLLLAMLPIFQILGTVLANVLLVVLQALTPILIALTPLIAEFARQWGEGLVNAIVTLTPLIVQLATFLSNNASTVVAITTVFLGFMGALKLILPILALVATYLARWVIFRVIQVGLTALLGTMAGPFIAVLKAVLFPIGALFRALGGFTGLLTRLPMLLFGLVRGVLALLGPVGIAIAVITTLWTTNEKFREAINKLIGVFFTLIGQIVDALMPALMAIFDAIAPLVGLVIDALVPVLNVLIDVFIQILDAVLPPLIGLITGFLIPVIRTLADILATVLVWVVKNLVVPIIQFLAAVIRDVLVPIIVWLANTIVVPLFKLIGQIVTWVWTNLLKPAFDAWVGFLRDILGPAVVWLWENIVKPSFQGIGDFIMWVWDNLIKPAFLLTQDGLDVLGGWFDTVVGAIGRKWDELRRLLAIPVNFLIETVWNNGLAVAWEAIDRFLGGVLPDVVRLNPITFASGGPVRGGVPGRDSVHALMMPGEHVLTTAEVKALGGHEMVYQLRKAALSGNLATFADGGTWRKLWGTVSQQFPSSRLSSAYRPGDPGFHGSGNAVDVAGPTPAPRGSAFMAGVNQWIAQNFGSATRELIYTPGINLLSGRPHTYNAGTRAAHYNHVHWAFPGFNGGATGAAGAGGGGGFSTVNPLAEGAKLLVNTMSSAAKGLLATIAAPPPEWMAVPKAMGTQMVDGTVNWVNAKIDELFPPMAFGGGGSGLGGPGSGPVVDQVKAVAARYGWAEGGAWSSLDRLIQKESGWNPNAQNPTSTAYGLFQFLDKTWAEFGVPKTSNPAQQAEVGLRRIKQRYGDPGAALAFHLRNNWYDNGGFLRPGFNMVHNDTGRPEPVLNQAQWRTQEALARFAETSMRSGARDLVGVGSGAGASPLVGTVENHYHTDYDASRAMADLDHHLRVTRRRV